MNILQRHQHDDARKMLETIKKNKGRLFDRPEVMLLNRLLSSQMITAWRPNLGEQIFAFSATSKYDDVRFQITASGWEFM